MSKNENLDKEKTNLLTPEQDENLGEYMEDNMLHPEAAVFKEHFRSVLIDIEKYCESTLSSFSKTLDASSKAQLSDILEESNFQKRIYNACHCADYSRVDYEQRIELRKSIEEAENTNPSDFISVNDLFNKLRETKEAVKRDNKDLGVQKSYRNLSNEFLPKKFKEL